ncbi:MAG: Hsp20/alpha crystallin family protein [Planctomycetaceae bacterium]|nr:Hsp20/alpha crystallin family protein [Planctomycetaceae bacterium]
MDLVKTRQRRSPLTRLQDEMNDLFGRFWEDSPLAWTAEHAWLPALDVAETEDRVIVEADMPGVKPEDIDISVQNGTLCISGQKKESHEEKTENYYHVERRTGSFRREIPLPTPVNSEKVEATFKEGVLKIVLPKDEKAQPKKIEIKS